MTHRISLAGVFPPIPTPFKENGDVDYAQLEANLQRWHHQPLSGYVFGGSNGEYAYLTEDERVECVRVARALTPRNRLLIAGSAMESTRATLHLTQRMAEAGADVAIVVTPNYYKARMTPSAMEQHYKQVAEASSIPVMLYNVPANTAYEMPASVALNLAAHPNIIGLKESGGDITKIGFMVSETRHLDFQIVAGSAGFLLAALAVGAVGGVVALANIAADQLAQMVDHFHAGELAKARDIQLPLIDANYAITSRFNVPGLKAAMDMLGYYGGPVRAPMQPLTDEEKKQLRVTLVKAGIVSDK